MIPEQMKQIYTCILNKWELAPPGIRDRMKDKIFGEKIMTFIGPTYGFSTHPGIPFKNVCVIRLPIIDPNVLSAYALKYQNSKGKWKLVNLFGDLYD
jgi:hypothetical protein